MGMDMDITLYVSLFERPFVINVIIVVLSYSFVFLVLVLDSDSRISSLWVSAPSLHQHRQSPSQTQTPSPLPSSLLYTFYHIISLICTAYIDTSNINIHIHIDTHTDTDTRIQFARSFWYLKSRYKKRRKNYTLYYAIMCLCLHILFMLRSIQTQKTGPFSLFFHLKER